MRAERLGSYSMVATVAGTPALSRLKSMERILRLCPPPRCHMVMSPALRRPPGRCLILVSGLCGRFVVRSSLTTVDLKRSVGVIGLYVFIAIVFLSRDEASSVSTQSRYRFCAYSGIFSPDFSFTYAFFQSGR